MLNEKSFITILSWMTKLGLTTNEMLIYAIIYGFTQDDQSYFHGSINYLSEWTNLSSVSVINNINKLIEKKLLKKESRPGCTNLYKALIPEDIIHTNKSKTEEFLPFDDFKPALKNKDYKVLSDEEKFEVDKNKKDIRTLMYWTNQLIENSELKEALINWLKLMQVNNKYQTLSLYKEKLQLLLDSTSSDEEAIEVVKDTTDKGYFTFKYSLDGLKKNGKTFSNQNLYNPYKEN